MLAEVADQEIISTVYRKLARRYHPDVDPSREAAIPTDAARTMSGWPADVIGAAVTTS